MAKKQSSHFECVECGHESQRWLGRCPACNAWNTFKEVKEYPVASGTKAIDARDGQALTVLGPVPLEEVSAKEGLRFTSGFQEFDRVLGSGFMTGSSILLGGEPGIGKSTLLSHAASAIGWAGGTVLYAHGEESAAQVRLRWERLGLPMNNVHVMDSCRLDMIQDALIKLKPRILVVDSVQTLVDPAVDSPPGSLQQAKFGVFSLAEACRKLGTTLCLVAHVTKEGLIAGPKVLEHMVDTVLYFEQADAGIRFLRAQKNRFGATDEMGFFRMDEAGLKEVANAAEVFLESREGAIPPGIALTAVLEGSRSFLVEIQGLVVGGKQGFSRLFSEKIDQRRVSRIAAILERHCSLRLAEQDIYVHVAGGVKLIDPCLDLSLAMAIHSARTGLPLPPGVVVLGELSLAGEVRTAPGLRKRIQAALDAGSARVFGPHQVDSENHTRYQSVRTIGEAVRTVFGTSEKQSDGKQ